MSCDCKLVHLNLTGEIYPSRFSQRVSCDSMLGSMFVYFRVILECFQVHTDRILSDLNHWQQWWNFPRYNRICRNNYTATTTIKGETSNTTGWAPRQTQQLQYIDPSETPFCPNNNVLQFHRDMTRTCRAPHWTKEHLLFAKVVHQCLCQLRDVFTQHFFAFSGRFHRSLQTIFHHRLGGPREFLRIIPIALAYQIDVGNKLCLDHTLVDVDGGVFDVFHQSQSCTFRVKGKYFSLVHVAKGGLDVNCTTHRDGGVVFWFGHNWKIQQGRWKGRATFSLGKGNGNGSVIQEWWLHRIVPVLDLTLHSAQTIPKSA